MLETLGTFVINIISDTGYLGIFLLMALESACIPIPSEATMPFSGSLVALGRFNLWMVVLIGALGNLAGSLLAYAVGYWGQDKIVRILIVKYGRYFLISEHEYDRAQKWFLKYGEIIVFASRMLPVVRTFISLPAGIAKMNLTKFILYTTIGSFFWSLVLTSVGMILGQNWQSLEVYFRQFDVLIVAGLTVGGLFYLYHKYKQLKKR
ncbi:MAG: DedA family protein [Patescibacteria group bacterium]|nr:DedA family protein [Patescibacteria group bacterium]MCL5095377.1 DedA family protein [Patescibacteria group bacterium]